jgi:hypothetical protein
MLRSGGLGVGNRMGRNDPSLLQKAQCFVSFTVFLAFGCDSNFLELLALGLGITCADRTTVTNSTLLVSQLPHILSSRVESFSVRKYDEAGEKQRKGMLTVLEMLREKYNPPTPTFPACRFIPCSNLSYLRLLTFSGYRPWGTLA